MKHTFVVGDVHGHPDLVEGLLLKAGVINGSGERVEGLGSIQVGDLANCVLEDRDGDLECLRNARRWFDTVLVGNHEHPYFGGPRFFGFHDIPEVREAVQAVGFRPCALVGDTLITHAGASGNWGWESAKQAHEIITAAWEDDPTRGIFSQIGRYRGGSAENGGILWSDLREPKSRDIRQVFGHTPQDELLSDTPGDDWLWQHVDWGGKHFHRLAGIWLDAKGDRVEIVRYEEGE